MTKFRRGPDAGSIQRERYGTATPGSAADPAPRPGELEAIAALDHWRMY